MNLKSGRFDRSSRIGTMFSLFTLLLATVFATPAYAQNPADPAGAESVAYLDCLRALQLSTPTEAAYALVEKCGHDPGQPIDEFVQQALSAVPAGAYIPVAEQLKPYRGRYSSQQFAYFEQLDRITQTSKSLDELDKRLADLESQAVATLGRSDSDLSVLGSISASRHGLEFLKSYQNSGLVAKGFWQDLKRVGAVVGAFAFGFAVAGPIGAAIAAWTVMAIIGNT